MSNYENENDNLLAEELTDAELENVQGGSTGFIFPVVLNNQFLQQVSEGNWGDTNQLGVQIIG